MNKKRWTAQTEVTDSLLKFREKRKWQIALRRYVLGQQPSAFYAPYFGLDIQNFRNWIELQFINGINWDNFSESWQFDHVVPLIHFDFQKESDLKLCWNFTNITVGLGTKKVISRLNGIVAKSYFDSIYRATGYIICRDMVKKIEEAELNQIEKGEKLQRFIGENIEYLTTLTEFSAYEFEKLNRGMEIGQITREKKFLKKFGGD